MVIVISVIMLHVGPTQVDRTIDLCGGPPRGTGLQNLRECIIGIPTLHFHFTQGQEEASTCSDNVAILLLTVQRRSGNTTWPRRTSRKNGNR